MTHHAEKNSLVASGRNQTLSVSGALRLISGISTIGITAEHVTFCRANDLSANLNVTKSDLWTGADEQTMIGGRSIDRFIFGPQYESNDGASYTTTTGDSNATNGFGILAGHTASDITITDFTVTEGNKFFMYDYKPADAEAAMQSLLTIAPIQGGHTSIMLDHDMKVTFLNVTDLKSSSIDIN